LKFQEFCRKQWIMKKRLAESSTPRESPQVQRVLMAVMQPPEPAFEESIPERKH
jgi:hypothetical protein